MTTSYTVLVVEQTDAVRRNTSRALTERGCRVLEAADAVEAFAVLTTPGTRVDLVLIGVVGGPSRGAGKGSGRTREPDPIKSPLLPEVTGRGGAPPYVADDTRR
jgi:hypothetical protein